jgi:hypothetical protein
VVLAIPALDCLTVHRLDRLMPDPAPQSRLFMSSMSRRELARRRPGRLWRRSQLVLVLLIIVLAAAAYLLARGIL